ncbi:type I-E CRISPR-associated protein Cse1/CasA [uncultured Microbulbifer sp.]|uniref:type I-E CRISPR-associated protein Cse1/CasA n=1 Tax=uncultured Microbulbifer sp. TaxID=348147 RepID=UPI0026065ABF|nr:type I-E CRISPR-associated protein Cse1/CasA [uncultured Microbulbifer sp.]
MNLIQDPWLPIIRQNGLREKIAPWQIAERDNPVVDIATVRPDFRGALYQFLIGLLQTAFVPEDTESWGEFCLEPPPSERLKAQLESYADAFELIVPSGPAFMQDLQLAQGEVKPIATLLIEAPGNKTCKDNLDHFVKRHQVQGICPSCAASALFTLQINAPSGGSGHRTSLRGGGPLTTLLLPAQAHSSLWSKLWLNTLPEEELASRPDSNDSNVFPWLAPTRLSDKTGTPTFPEDTHSLQMYWAMPRRIRLNLDALPIGPCDLCGEDSVERISHFITKNYGINYEGPWLHPLTPYRHDPKKKNPPLSLKGQQGGLGYRHWLSLLWKDASNGDQASKVVNHFNEEYGEVLEVLAGDSDQRLWSFGYDMDNMKARCWYEQQMPVIHVHKSYREQFIQLVGQLVQAAKEVVKELRYGVKTAWYASPKEAKGDFSLIDQHFWQETEVEYYRLLKLLSQPPTEPPFLPAQVAGDWARTLRHSAKNVFDHWVLDGVAEDMNMKRITKARRLLKGKLQRLGSLKALDSAAKVEQREGV